MSHLILNEIRMRYGAFEALKGIDAKIEEGEFIVIVGPSGCGKSSLLRAIAGLEKISGGEIVLGGRQIQNIPPSKRGLAMVFQSYALYPQKTVAQNMGFALQMAKKSKAEIQERVNDAARILQIEELLDRKPGELSGGQRQRVAIGRAIVREPEVFLFDEPLSNLDASLRVEMRVELSRLHKSLKSTMIYVTHDQVEAMTMADRVIVLNAGQIAQAGPPMELYENPHDMFVAGFIGSPKINFLEAKIEAKDGSTKANLSNGGTSIKIPTVDISPESGAKVTLGIRPEHIQVGDLDDATPLKLIVSLVEKLGEETILYGTLENGANMVVKSPKPVALPENQTIDISIPNSKIHIFDTNGTALKRAEG